MAIPVKKAILEAWKVIDLEAVERISTMKLRRRAEEARKLLEEKAEHPVFESVEFWWLDEFVEKIEFGQHSYTASDLKLMDPEQMKVLDDRTVTVTWRCGLKTTVSSGVVRDSHDPKHKATLWDGYILRYPDRYPQLAEEIRKKQSEQ